MGGFSYLIRRRNVSPATHWYPGGNQTVGNLKVARQETASKELALLFIIEGAIGGIELWTEATSLRHLTFSE